MKRRKKKLSKKRYINILLYNKKYIKLNNKIIISTYINSKQIFLF